MARYTFHAKFWHSLLVWLIVVLFLQLSSWQWHRYHLKLDLAASYQAQNKAAAIPLTTALAKAKLQTNTSEHVFIKVVATGHYDNQHQIVLDNRSFANKTGYEVLTPLILDTKPGTILLVNRGFIPSGKYWHMLPDLHIGSTQVTLQGILTKPTKAFSLGPVIEASQNPWPLRAARIDLTELQGRYEKPLLPYVLLLAPQQSGSYPCQWSYPQLFAERSLGYTFQWLALACITIILWLVMSIKKNPKS
jgi:surfeit locus 1 family protein